MIRWILARLGIYRLWVEERNAKGYTIRRVKIIDGTPPKPKRK